MPRPYKVPFYPIVPWISIISGSYIVLAAIITQFTLVANDVIITLLGLIFYTETQIKFKK